MPHANLRAALQILPAKNNGPRACILAPESRHISEFMKTIHAQFNPFWNRERCRRDDADAGARPNWTKGQQRL